MTDHTTTNAATTASTAATSARTTTGRRRARLLVPAALAVLALTATASVSAVAAANTSPKAAQTTTIQHTAVGQAHHGDAKNPKAMLDAWIRLWNGDSSQAPRIISPDFRVHAALMDGSDSGSIRGAEGVVAWIGQIRAAFPDLYFSEEVRPLVDGKYASVRWTVTGTYAGGFPGAKAEPGTVVTFTGTDTLRMKDGKFVEYWLNSDTLELLGQLQVG
ncbi:ester cyclase [Streptomyces sp. NBC_01429]|uniref:ester cyclase n=1 Tax=Streptomyces sp. NBC_01429 TaxID=2903862 RepID=UPI002E29BD57|nr:ester cyclase [Streptomyces sp. NBC_01429]